MNKIIIKYEAPCKNKIVEMKDMPLGSIGEIIEDGFYKGIIVRRTICTSPFLVEDLSNPGKDKCWSNPNTTMVKLLPDAEIKVIIQLTPQAVESGDLKQLAPELFRKKKKLTITNIEWEKGNEGVVYPYEELDGCCINSLNWDDLLDKPPMTMTLEWEE